MREVVRATFATFQGKFEGVIPYPYVDIKQLVTIAIGILWDPYAPGMPLVKADGSPASEAECHTEWDWVKNGPDAHVRAMAGGASSRARSVTTLRLTQAGIEAVVWRKAQQMNAFLVSRFHDFEDWPADAQMGTLGMAWALGPAFAYPKWEAAARAGNWATCAVECYIPDGDNSGLRPRNAANKLCFENADDPFADPDVLYWPDTVAQVEARQAPTVFASRYSLNWRPEILPYPLHAPELDETDEDK